MRQITLFKEDCGIKEQVVNVASVPQRSPFRYPGGKTWLVPTVRRWLSSKKIKPVQFIEPFAGGGIISLTVAFEHLAGHVIMVELDDDVAAVWKTILDENGEWLADRIVNFELTVDNIQKELSKANPSLREKAFQTILKNRVYHGGILAPGAGLIKSGENGKGIRSRWYPVTLSRRIHAIENVKDTITFIEGNGMDVMKKHVDESGSVFFIDPPYTAGGKKAGARLYRYSSLDHEDLFCRVGSLAGDFLMTYDNAPEIKELAERFGFMTRTISMKNTHHATMSELLISRDLNWF